MAARARALLQLYEEGSSTTEGGRRKKEEEEAYEEADERRSREVGYTTAIEAIDTHFLLSLYRDDVKIHYGSLFLD